MAKATASLIPYDMEGQAAAAQKTVENYSVATMQLNLKNLVITDEETYQQCITMRNAFSAAEKKLFDFWEPLTKAANALHKMLTAKRGEMMAPFSAGKVLATRKCEDYVMNQRRLKAQMEAEIQKTTRQAQGEMRDEAEELMARGFVREARELQQKAVMMPAPVLQDTPVAQGERRGDKYTGTVVDIMAVLKSIVDGKTPLVWEVKPGDERPLVNVDPVVLNAIVKRQQDGLRIPGIEVKEGVRISSAGERS